MARSMFSLGMLLDLALSIARRNRKFISELASPPRAATMISRDSLVNSLPRRASSAPFLCLMVLHLE